MALKDDGPVEAWSLDRLVVDDDGARRGLVETCEQVEDRCLAASGMADHAGEFTAGHIEPKVLEDGGAAAAGRRKALGNSLNSR